MRAFQTYDDLPGTPREFRKTTTIWAVQLNELFRVATLEGEVQGRPGDWLAKGAAGELYPIAAAVFAKTYEPVDRPMLAVAQGPGGPARDFIFTPDGTVIAYILNPQNQQDAPPFWKFCINGAACLRSERLVSSMRTVGPTRIWTVCAMKLVDGDWVHFTRRELNEAEPTHFWGRFQGGKLLETPMQTYKDMRKREMKEAGRK